MKRIGIIGLLVAGLIAGTPVPHVSAKFFKDAQKQYKAERPKTILGLMTSIGFFKPLSVSSTVVTPLIVEDQGGATGTASGATIPVSGIKANVGDWLVVQVAADNAGASGVSALTGVTDSGGNTYTQRILSNRTAGGAANDGATLGVYTAAITTNMSSGTVTASFSPNVASRAIQVYRIRPALGSTISFITADSAGATGSSSSYATNTVSVTINDTIFGFAASEASTLPSSGDTDTTAGVWSTLITQNATTGTGSTSMQAHSQYKLVNATGNQSYGVTAGSAGDFAASYLVLRGSGPPVATPIGATSGVASAMPMTITLPGGGIAGDIVLICACNESGGNVTTWPAGWEGLTELGTGSNSMAIGWRLLNGTEGSSISVTQNAGNNAHWICYLIRCCGVKLGLEVGAIVHTGSGTTSDPPSLTASWGALDNLWFAFSHLDLGQNVSNYPSGYNLFQTTTTTGTSRIAGCAVQKNGATEDPGAFTWGGSANSKAETVVVKPLTAGETAPPIVNGRNNNTTGGTSSHVASMPSGIVAGELLLAIWSDQIGSSITLTWPGTWTKFAEQSGANARISLGYRIATGGDTLTLTTSGNCRGNMIVQRIGNAGSAPPEGSVTTQSSTTTPDPPSLSPSWGSKLDLWFAITARQGSNVGPTAYPTNYTNNQVTQPGSSTDGTMSIASRVTEAASENPGVYTYASAFGSLAATVGISSV